MQGKDSVRRNLLRALVGMPAALALWNSRGFAQSIIGQGARHTRGSFSSPRPAPPQPARPVDFTIDTLSQYDIRNYGAVGDGKTNDTVAVQYAINAAAANGGGVVYIPAGVFVVRNLFFPPTGGNWVLIWMDGSLYLTQTLEMNERCYALVGRSGAVFQAFQQQPSAALLFEKTINPVIRISANPVYLEGLNLKGFEGDGIVATDAACELYMNRMQLTCYGTSADVVPLRVENSTYSFGLYIQNSVLQAPILPGAHSLVLRNYSIVRIQDSTLIGGGIFMSAEGIEAANYSFENVLYENGYTPFLQIDNSGAWFTGITLDHIEMADPAVYPAYLLDSSGTGETVGVLMTMARNAGGYAMVTGNSPIKGLYVFPASSTDKSKVEFLGQQDYYAYFDCHEGVTNLARLSLGYEGTVITKHLSAASTLDFPAISPGGQQEVSMSLSGAQVGDSCDASPESGAEPGLIWSSYVSGQDTIVVRLVNATPSPISPSPRTWTVNVWQH
ncbi:MAG TPA: glycosyl hydrolase family 28-related protein [Candidatus Acidoferrales bacterium]|nr:glycosyl hydrolase family 28-related protein [Candidatus Acidoferrales bacterium]